MRRHVNKLAVGAAALTAAVAAGGAIAATQLNPRQESQAVVNDAAEQLGVEPSELTAALKEALANRVDAAVEAGRLTEEQGAELKSRIQSGEVPLVGLGGPGFRHHRGGPHHLDAAASYLGMTEANLRTALEGGKTLAQVARDRGKSVDGLVTALVNDERTELQAAVRAGRLTDAQRDAIVSGLEARITRLVNGQGPPAGGHRFGPGPAFGAAPPDLGSVA
jgi:Zn-dependent alcohol dehydrogenase